MSARVSFALFWTAASATLAAIKVHYGGRK